MIKSYFITALRHFKRDKFFTILNLVGLTIGVTSFILLALFIRHELSYDKFHTDAERIYVFGDKANTRSGPINNARYLTGLSLKLQELVPELSEMVHISPNSEALVEIGDARFYENNIKYVGQPFFDVFDFEILQGDVDFSKPNQIVISERVMEKYFDAKTPVGESIKVNNKVFQVAAVIENSPANTHIKYEILISNENEIAEGLEEYPNERGGSVSFVAFRLPNNSDVEEVYAKAQTVIEENFVENQKSKFDDNGVLTNGLYFVPFTDVHLKSQFDWTVFPVSDMRYVYIFGSIALLILVIACLNYVNLATARSLKKMKEVGVRKVLGADKRQIIRQNMVESTVFAFLSVIMAFAISERLLPAYNNLIDRQLELYYWSLEFFVFVIGLSLLVGLFAGVYPALRMSQFKALKALTGRDGSKEKVGIRRGLVWFQFFIAQGLIMATLIIQSQLSYLQNKDLGYEREELVYIKANRDLKDNAQVFKEELASIPGVDEISVSNEILGYNSIYFRPMKEIPGFEDSEDYLVYDSFEVDSSFVSTMGMRFVQGGNFNGIEDIAPEQALIVNEAFVEKLGYDEPIGQKFEQNGDKYIVGVVKDFHNETLKVSIQPASFAYDKNPFQFFNLRLKTSNVRETVSAIESKWDELVPDKPIQLTFYDQEYNNQYATETRLGNIFNVFSGIAITISILGLIGLTAFSAEQRMKEFGIRKVLGAELKQLIYLLSKEFVLLILVAFIIAAPLAYFGLNDWLNAFVYKVEIGPFTYVLAFSITLVIALLSMAYQFKRVSNVNPSEILRNE